MRFCKFSLVLLVLFFTACSKKDVTLSYTNAENEVPQLGNLVFKFSKNLVPDSMLNHWDSTEYISFSPEIKGAFRWQGNDELVFSPGQALLPATTYTATLKKALTKHSKYGGVASKSDIVFNTPNLAFEHAQTIWTLSNAAAASSAVPQIDFSFNYAVAPDALKSKLAVYVNDKATDYDMVTASQNNTISIKLRGLATEDRDYNLRAVVKKGLVPGKGKNGLPNDIEYTSVIPSPYVLLVNDVAAQHDGTAGTITVKTSQQLNSSNLMQLVSISPKVAFSTELTEDGFVISSPGFDVNNSYTVLLTKGLRGKIGGVLKENYETSVAFGSLEPSIGFDSKKAMYLASKGANNIGVKINGLPRVKVTVSKIYENNILTAMSNGYYPQDNGAESYEDGDEGSGSLMVGDVIYEKEIDTRSLPKLGSARLFKFNPNDELKDFKGIYHIKISSTEDYWISESRFISRSDIGLIAKEGRDKILVFANGLTTAQGLPGVGISVYGTNNQLLGTGTTAADGLAEIAYTRKEFAGFKPAMVIAKTEGDFNYLPFQGTRVNTSRFDVGGKRINSTGLDAFVYAERDIYRPGEAMHFAVVLRDAQFNNPGSLPIKMKMLLPNGKELTALKKTLNAQGGADATVNLTAAAITGTYLLEVYNGNDVLMATKNFKVEEFMPDRIKVNATLDKAELSPGGTTNLHVSAASYFGPPAANRNYECEIQIQAQAFNPKKFSQYNFDLANQQSFFDKVLRQGKTDDQGNANEAFSVPTTYKNVGNLKTKFFTTVFDETGRPVSRNTAATIYTQPVFFGINSGEYNYVALNQPARFSLVALNNKEQVTTASAQVEIVKHEYKTVLTKSGDLFRYQSQEELKILASQTITIAGQATQYSYVPRTSGNYELRIHIPGASAYVSEHFYSYGTYGADNNSFEVNTEGEVEIALDKNDYVKGDRVKALFKAPFNGRMLVTVETDKVLSHQYVDVVNKTATIDVLLADEHFPNAYITATLFKPHAESTMPLTVANGFKNINVKDETKRIAVSIDAAKTARSKTTQKVTVKATPGSMVTLAAVDNGILAVSNFSTPDPYTYFYQQRALGVSAYNIYPLLFPELRARYSSTGGDGDANMNQRQNPMPNKRVKLVSYWSGVQMAGSNGTASFEFAVPQFSGQLRLMAVAVNNNKFGAAEAFTTIADPLVLSTALPRFLSPGDSVLMPVTISNTTNKAASVSTTAKVQGPLQLAGAATQSINVSANSEATVLYKVAATNTIAAGKITVEVNGLGEKFVDETDITVRPPSTLQRISGSGVIAGNTQQNVSINISDFIPSTAGYNLMVGNSPAVRLSRQLQYLVTYPYGCTEQTISAAFPQLYFTDISNALNSGTALQAAAVDNVLAAIQKIKMRQLYNGGLTLWDNESSESWWCTAYAAHFLWEAQKAGFTTDRQLLETMLSYLTNKLRNKELINYTYNRNQQKKIAPKEVAYSLYVLALAGKSNVPVMNYYKANQKELALDSKYLLSVSYAIAGDRQRFKELLPTSFSGEESEPASGGSFYSPIRDEAVALNALLEVDPQNAQIPVMAKHIADRLQTARYFSTQESGFALLAMGKMASAAAKNKSAASILVNGKTVGKTEGEVLNLSARQLGNTIASIKTVGSGNMYYWWQSSGISASGAYLEEDKYLKIRRKFFDRYGRAIGGNTFKQNELVVVQITLEQAFNGSIENVVATDILPAGFEIENSRLKDLPDLIWIKDAATPEHTDVRDDRIHFFTNMNGGKQVFYYMVRAVSPGVFRMGPASADAMYNGEYHSYNGAGTIVVNR
jgi:uncharacterized protein YfaS (alpha-2-macroglobulin family)